VNPIADATIDPGHPNIRFEEQVNFCRRELTALHVQFAERLDRIDLKRGNFGFDSDESIDSDPCAKSVVAEAQCITFDITYAAPAGMPVTSTVPGPGLTSWAYRDRHHLSPSRQGRRHSCSLAIALRFRGVIKHLAVQLYRSSHARQSADPCIDAHIACARAATLCVSGRISAGFMEASVARALNMGSRQHGDGQIISRRGLWTDHESFSVWAW
jgi:hypothetical protein